MVSRIKDWSTTPADNDSAPPYGAPENGTNVNQFNNIVRQMMADIREWYNTPQWRDLGHTPTYASSTSFTIPGDVTASYIVGQRIRITDTSTLYGTVASSSYSAPNTTVGVTLDSGSVTASVEAIAVGVDPTNSPISPDAVGLGALAALDTVGTSQIDNDAVTYDKMQNVSLTSRVLARKSSGAGNVEEATISEVLDFIGSAAQGDILYRGASGWERLGAGTSGQFLKTQGASANPVWAAGGVIGGAVAKSGAKITVTGSIPMDDTIPQSNEGTEVLTVDYTPKSATSTLLVTATFASTGASNGAEHVTALFRDSATDAFSAIIHNGFSNVPVFNQVIGTVTSGSTSQTTFKVRHALRSSATVYVNADTGSTRVFGGVASCTLTVLEIA